MMDLEGELFALVFFGLLPAVPILILLKYLYIRRTQPVTSAHGDTIRTKGDQIRSAIIEGLEGVTLCAALALLIAAELLVKSNLVINALVIMIVASLMHFVFSRLKWPLYRVLQRWLP